MGKIFKKLQERRLEWYGHVLTREEEYVGKMVMEVPAKRTGEDRSGHGRITSGTRVGEKTVREGSARPG